MPVVAAAESSPLSASARRVIRDIRLSQLQYFTVLAEELNFHRASERVFITQSALSRGIAELERTLGARLFDRDHRHVRLTRPGHEFLPHARQLLASIMLGVSAAQGALNGCRQRLGVGFSDHLAESPLAPLVATFCADHRAVVLELSDLSVARALAALAEGTVDLAFTVLPSGGGLLHEPVTDIGATIALPRTHHLAGCRLVELGALEHETLLLARASNPSITGLLLQACHRAGFIPRVELIGGSELPSSATIETAVASGEGLAIMVGERAVHPQVVRRPLVGVSWPVSVSVRRGDDSVSLSELRRHVLETVRGTELTGAELGFAAAAG